MSDESYSRKIVFPNARWDLFEWILRIAIYWLLEERIFHITI